METQIGYFWVFASATEFKAFFPQNTIFLLVLLFTAYLATSILYWIHPGGHAWGKYYWLERSLNRTKPNVYSDIKGPRGLPVLGCMHLMTNLAHHKLAATANHFGAERLMALSLGETRVIVTCNGDVARDILNSSVFVDRPVKESAYGLKFHRAIGFAPCGVYWRTLRRIATNHLFCPKQISLSEPHRFNIASQMVKVIQGQNGAFYVREILKQASRNHMMCLVFGRDYTDSGFFEPEREEMSFLVEEGYELLGKTNWSDHIPWLAGLDLQRIKFRCSKLVPKVNQFVSRIIDEHVRDQTGKRNRDFVDVLISLQGSERLSQEDTVAVLWEMIFRGTDTVAVLLEWVLARMVMHPDVQSKVQDELDRIVGRSRPLMPSDNQSTVYLQAVIKETLRLHPPGPLLSWARLATKDTTVDGRHVPAGTTAMVNMWAIMRDPQVWSDPLRFEPERFVGADVDTSVLGSDLWLAPFGSGRRACPGRLLGLATVTFWVGTLLREFEWAPSDHNPLDLSEVLRLSCEMANPLKIKAQPRRK